MRHRLRGDEGELFRRHGDRLLRVTRLPLQCSHALAEDAAAHAWLQLGRAQPERTESLPGWLRVVALHEGFRLLRQAGCEPPFEDACSYEGDDERVSTIPLEVFALPLVEAPGMTARERPAYLRRFPPGVLHRLGCGTARSLQSGYT